MNIKNLTDEQFKALSDEVDNLCTQRREFNEIDEEWNNESPFRKFQEDDWFSRSVYVSAACNLDINLDVPENHTEEFWAFEEEFNARSNTFHHQNTTVGFNPFANLKGLFNG